MLDSLKLAPECTRFHGVLSFAMPNDRRLVTEDKYPCLWSPRHSIAAMAGINKAMRWHWVPLRFRHVVRDGFTHITLEGLATISREHFLTDPWMLRIKCQLALGIQFEESKHTIHLVQMTASWHCQIGRHEWCFQQGIDSAKFHRPSENADECLVLVMYPVSLQQLRRRLKFRFVICPKGV